MKILRVIAFAVIAFVLFYIYSVFAFIYQLHSEGFLYQPPLNYELIDREGTVKAGPFKYVRKFQEGLAPVAAAEHGTFGFINKSGDIVIPYKFENADSFSEGLAAVRIDGKWGYINNEVQIVIAPHFSSA